MEGLTALCPYCKKFSKKVTGKDIYPHLDDLSHLVFYQCKPCDAYVGTHKGTIIPLGTMANEELRYARMDAHMVFDQIWKHGYMTRKNAYAWLADEIGTSVTECHIGMFGLEQCKNVSMVSERKLCELI